MIYAVNSRTNSSPGCIFDIKSVITFWSKDFLPPEKTFFLSYQTLEDSGRE